MDKVDTEYLAEVLQKTRRKLLDTTRRTRLLNFKELARDIAIIDEMPDPVFQSLVIDQRSFSFDPITEEGEDDESAEPLGRSLPLSVSGGESVAGRYSDDCLQTPFRQKELDRRLRRLYLDHRTLIEETGANSLFLAVGFLEWSDNSDQASLQKSPLMLLPVRLEREGGAGAATYRLHFDDEALDTNYSLVEKLRSNFNIQLPTVEDEQLPEDYWQKIDHAIFTMRDSGWRIVREIVLGLFRFNKQIMWHDLDPARWPNHSQLFDKSVLTRILLGSKSGETPPGQIIEEYSADAEEGTDTRPQLKLVLDADSSQYSALLDALNLKGGLVIEGPPGTGKSQTIANLIATALGQGKSVLFIAEKMAALEVVFRRLDEVGLGDFCLQLHGLKTSKKELLTSLNKRMSVRFAAPRELEQQCVQLEQAKLELIDYSRALNELVGPEQVELYRLPWRLELLRSELPSGFEPLDIPDSTAMSLQTFEWARGRLDDLGKEWEAVPPLARRYWAGFLPKFADDTAITTINSSLSDVIRGLDQLKQWLDVNGVIDAVPSIGDVRRLLYLGAHKPSQVLPEITRDIPEGMIHTIVHRDLISEVDEVIALFVEFETEVSVVNELFDYSSPNSETFARTVQDQVSAISGVSVANSAIIGDLPIECQRFETTLSHFDLLPQIAEPTLLFRGGFARRLEDYESLASFAEKLTDGPGELSLYGTPIHAKKAALTYLAAAQQERDALIAASEELNVFRLSESEDTRSLQEAERILREKANSLFRIANPEYRRSKRLVKMVLRDSKEFSVKKEEFLTVLKGLCDFCVKRDEFRQNENYATALGDLFRGLDTDWSALTELIDFSQKFKGDWGIERANATLADWDEHCERLERSANGLRTSIAEIKHFQLEHPFPDAIWQRPVAEIRGSLDSSAHRLNEAKDALCQAWCASGITLEKADDVLRSFAKANNIEGRIQNIEGFSALLGDRWEGISTDLEGLVAARKWLQIAFDAKGVDRVLLKWLMPLPSRVESELLAQLLKLAAELRAGLGKQFSVLEGFGSLERRNWFGEGTVSIDAFRNRQQGCRDTLASLPLLARWRITYEQVEHAGYKELADLVSHGQLPGRLCSSAFVFSLYHHVLVQCIQSNELLASFGRIRYENIQQRFAQADREVMSLNARQIASDVSGVSVPEGVGHGRVAGFSERRLLEYEVNKKTRHIPIRQLMRRAGNALQALKPCYLMSPLSVAQYLPPGEIEFDIVVMDEASQMRPEEALGAIARARTAVIVGDPKQLPPTSFFDASLAEDEDSEETVIDDTESILDVCLKQLPYRRLRWHYRSQHESLIQFSNEQFYDGDLIVFPSPRGDAREFGVHMNYIESPSYFKGRNRNEAQVVVRHIVQHYNRTPEASLGVAAFNKRQAEEIQLLLDNARSTDPSLDKLISENCADEPLFIKNLENVQGDERDVIFISTTYGPEKQGGPVAQRFGPINSDVGWRRLNVIATRAKQRVEVFSSMKPTDIIIGDGARRGPRALRNYLEYATTGRVSEHGTVTGNAPDSEFEMAVGKVLEDLGYQYEPQVGVAGFFIDIGVCHPDRPGEFLLGVECDGAAYHSSRSVRDRDRLRQEILESKSWYIHRIWSTSWFHTRAAEVDRLRDTLKERLEEDRVHRPLSEDVFHEETEVADIPVLSQAIEQELIRESLKEALERFWQVNIKPMYPARERSVLSETMIRVLTSQTPLNQAQWHRAIPMDLRTQIEPGETQFLDDVFEVIAEYE